MTQKQDRFLHKHTLTVRDSEVDQWLAAQNNVSQSVSLLVHRAISQIGMQDYVLALNDLVTDSDLAAKTKAPKTAKGNTLNTPKKNNKFNNLGLDPN